MMTFFPLFSSNGDDDDNDNDTVIISIDPIIFIMMMAKIMEYYNDSDSLYNRTSIEL